MHRGVSQLLTDGYYHTAECPAREKSCKRRLASGTKTIFVMPACCPPSNRACWNARSPRSRVQQAALPVDGKGAGMATATRAAMRRSETLKQSPLARQHDRRLTILFVVVARVLALRGPAAQGYCLQHNRPRVEDVLSRRLSFDFERGHVLARRAPNTRQYSRLNWEGLSYPTRNSASAASSPYPASAAGPPEGMERPWAPITAAMGSPVRA